MPGSGCLHNLLIGFIKVSSSISWRDCTEETTRVSDQSASSFTAGISVHLYSDISFEDQNLFNKVPKRGFSALLGLNRNSSFGSWKWSLQGEILYSLSGLKTNSPNWWGWVRSHKQMLLSWNKTSPSLFLSPGMCCECISTQAMAAAPDLRHRLLILWVSERVALGGLLSRVTFSCWIKLFLSLGRI